ncbi:MULTISPECIES: hypothetical protein [Bradyrhizobium]|uniref:hypothetical protein n=1 Tax=Bradyrhizobium TaxID=374 RepID=UPI003512C2E9
MRPVTLTSAEEFADRLAAEQENGDPHWDRGARVSTCREALLKDLLSVVEARNMYGAEVVSEALGEIQQRLKAVPYSDESFVAVARAVDPKRPPVSRSDYPYFDGGHHYAKYAGAVAVLVLVLGCGTILGSWLEFTGSLARLPSAPGPVAAVAKMLPLPESPVEVNNDRVSLTDGTPPLKYSVPDTTATEKMLESEVASAQAKAEKSPEIIADQIRALKARVENDIIAIEARKRALARSHSKTSDASFSVGTVPKLSIPARFDVR